MATQILTEERLVSMILEEAYSETIRKAVEEEIGGFGQGKTWSTLFVEQAADNIAFVTGADKRTVLKVMVDYIENDLDGSLWAGRDSDADVSVMPFDSRFVVEVD